MKPRHTASGRKLLAVLIAALASPFNFAAEPAATAPVAEGIVELPPLEVSAGLVKVRPWQYTMHGGIEILSRCTDAVTSELAQSVYRAEQLFAYLVPEEFQVKLAVPKILVLADQKSTPSSSRDLVQGFSRIDNVRFLPNLRLNDLDAVVIYAIVDEDHFDGMRLGLTPGHIRFVLERRTPPLPAWLIEGITGLTPDLSFDRGGLGLGPADWLAGPEEENLKKDADFPRTLLPMGELLERPRAPEPADQSDRARRWRAQSALFVRWALDGADPLRRTVFWRFVKQACAMPVTEAMFQDCFALSYADVRDRLSDYLPGALKNPVRVQPEKLAKLPDPQLRLATSAEIGRIKGDWERLEITYVKNLHPQYVARYEEQANLTLTKAYASDPSDAGLKAVIALRACDAGDDARARPFLEAAMQAKVVRPRVYYELARIRYAEALKQPAGRDGLLSAEQANTVLQPLAATSGQLPPLAQTYALAAEVWSHSDARLSPSHLALLDDGLRLFPMQLTLLYQVALVKMRQGLEPDALALVERGQQLAATATAKARFEKLRAFIAGRRGPSATATGEGK